ncbi:MULTISPECIES: hypothetical protein [unclassified Mycobacterium]|uniref:hypothetical protein n=1 Tax=unclassified Mycobacterium TaxID=2642494 RepID=UPI0029C8D34F|nr:MULTISPECIES: hypothetical protein [unclassified Mycobacterium]
MATDLDAYQRLGDLEKPFELSAKDERRQQDRLRLRDSMRCDVRSLTYDQYSAGAPCPGCGLPYVDAEPFDFKGTMNLSDVGRLRYDAEQSRYKADHGSCGSHRHGVSGSLTMHCGKCCPPPPMSPAQRERIRALMSHPTAPHDLMIWRLRLYCGHTLDRTAHRSHTTVQSAFTGATRCLECGCDPATVVDARAIGLAAQPSQPAPSPVARKPTRAQLLRRIGELEAEVARLRSD